MGGGVGRRGTTAAALTAKGCGYALAESAGKP